MPARVRRDVPDGLRGLRVLPVPQARYWRGLFEGTPPSLSVGLKVPESITVARWPSHARYGEKAGQENKWFLDTALLRSQFTRLLEPFAERVAVLIFEFGTFAKATFANVNDFLFRLDDFLGASRAASATRSRSAIRVPGAGLFRLPGRAWRGPRAERLDADAGAGAQLDRPGVETADFFVVRALLSKGRSYEQAVKAFEPYEKIREPNVSAEACGGSPSGPWRGRSRRSCSSTTGWRGMRPPPSRPWRTRSGRFAAARCDELHEADDKAGPLQPRERTGRLETGRPGDEERILHHFREGTCRTTSSLPSTPRRGLGGTLQPEARQGDIPQGSVHGLGDRGGIRLVRYPAGLVNPAHTHPCGHGLYVLEGDLVTHKGTFGPGSFVWFPEGEVMEHGASPAADVTVIFITNKSFRIDYVE